jgi:transcriptional regulator with XRE-family HTH domain
MPKDAAIGTGNKVWGEQLRKLRDAAGLSRPQLVAKMDNIVGFSNVANWEAGSCGIPQSRFVKLCAALPGVASIPNPPISADIHDPAFFKERQKKKKREQQSVKTPIQENNGPTVKKVMLPTEKPITTPQKTKTIANAARVGRSISRGTKPKGVPEVLLKNEPKFTLRYSSTLLALKEDKAFVERLIAHIDGAIAEGIVSLQDLRNAVTAAAGQ